MTRRDTDTAPVAPNPGAGASARWDAASALAREYRSLEGALGAALRVSRVSGLLIAVARVVPERPAWVLRELDPITGELPPGCVAEVRYRDES